MLLPLDVEITSFFPNHAEHVIRNLLIITEGIFSAKSTNLNLVKDELSNILENQETTKPESNYKRLIRFFQIDDTEKQSLTRSLLCVGYCILGLKGRKPKYLTLDGTSWELGEKKIHLITLGIVINGVSIPICWEELNKKGTSNYEERKALFNKAFKWYDLSGMILLADREYIGEEWFKYLVDKGLNFVIRLKKSVYKNYVDEQRGQKAKYFKHQKWRYIGMERQAKKQMHKNVGVAKQIEIDSRKYTFVVFKNPKINADEPLVYFLSTLNKKQKIVKVYPIRWSIECCFKHLKSNGFNLEDLNLRKKEKIKLMMAIVSFLYTLCIHQGILAYSTFKKSDFKKYRDGTVTLAVSIFQKGRALLAGKFHNLRSFLEFLKDILWSKKLPQWVHVQ